jgi:hypothetical protein
VENRLDGFIEKLFMEELIYMQFMNMLMKTVEREEENVI